VLDPGLPIGGDPSVSPGADAAQTTLHQHSHPG
jgi:hypothetical protein